MNTKIIQAAADAQHLPLSAELGELRKQLYEKDRQIQALQAQIDELASHDYLTGALNRRSLIAKLETELQRAYRTGHPFCFVMIDLDHLRQINDEYGQPVGDEVLRKVSASANKSLRTLDSFGRLGGEEFGIVLPVTWLDQGMIAIERLRTAVTGYNWDSVQPGLQVRFSAGITTNTAGDTVETISKRADEALVKAKQEGRDRIASVEAGLPHMPVIDD